MDIPDQIGKRKTYFNLINVNENKNCGYITGTKKMKMNYSGYKPGIPKIKLNFETFRKILSDRWQASLGKHPTICSQKTISQKKRHLNLINFLLYDF